VQPFHERHGLQGAMVAPTKIIAGLGLSLGLELLDCPGATGDYRSDFGAKVQPWGCASTKQLVSILH
jgi:2,3-bisphosphoglycerate-independent phosphoglycerate mutase